MSSKANMSAIIMNLSDFQMARHLHAAAPSFHNIGRLFTSTLWHRDINHKKQIGVSEGNRKYRVGDGALLQSKG